MDILKSSHGEKSMKAQFIIYADTVFASKNRNML